MIKMLTGGLVGFFTGRAIYTKGPANGSDDGDHSLEDQLADLQLEIERKNQQIEEAIREKTELQSDLADKANELAVAKTQLEQVNAEKEGIDTQLRELSKQYEEFKQAHKGASCEAESGGGTSPDTGNDSDLDVSKLVFPEVYKYNTDFDSLAELADFAVIYAIGIKNQADQFVINTSDTVKVSDTTKSHHYKAVFTDKSDSELVTKTLYFYNKEGYDTNTGTLKIKPVRVNHVTYSVLNELEFAKYLFESKIVKLEDGIVFKSDNIKSILNDDLAFQETSGAPVRIVITLVVNGVLHIFKKYGGVVKFDENVTMPGSIANYN